MPMMRKSAMLDTHTRIIETRGIKGLWDCVAYAVSYIIL
jgi:hypothetical protein